MRMAGPMQRYFLILLFLASTALAEGLDVDRVMADHGLHLLPLEELEGRHVSSDPTYVAVDDGALVISNEGEYASRMTHKEGDLLYKATNRGEWGGSLEVTRGGVAEELMHGNITHLLPAGGSLYVIEGLDHLGMSRGSVSVIRNIKEPARPERVTLLPEAPQVVYPDLTQPGHNRIIIASANGVVALSQGQLDILHWQAFWTRKMIPTSLTRLDDYYFIGLSHGVAVLPAPRGSREIRFYADQTLTRKPQGK